MLLDLLDFVRNILQLVQLICFGISLRLLYLYYFNSRKSNGSLSAWAEIALSLSTFLLFWALIIRDFYGIAFYGVSLLMSWIILQEFD